MNGLEKISSHLSSGQFGSYNPVFGPRAQDGLPSLMFDPVTGKIWIWTGDMYGCRKSAKKTIKQ